MIKYQTQQFPPPFHPLIFIKISTAPSHHTTHQPSIILTPTYPYNPP